MFFLSRSHGFGEALRQTLRRVTARGVPVLVGVILLTAAVLKAHQLATSPTREISIFTTRWFLIGLVELELALGLWLLSAVYPKQARVAALAVFAGFCSVSLYQALSGEHSCGCFGNLPINPWYTLLFDLAAAAMLWRWTPEAFVNKCSEGGVGYGTPVHVFSA